MSKTNTHGECAAEIHRLQEVLAAIGDYAHHHSTGPAVPDALWEVRRMAYDAIRPVGATGLSEFIRDASPERKAEVFGRVMDKVAEQQKAVIDAASGVPLSTNDGKERA